MGFQEVMCEESLAVKHEEFLGEKCEGFQGESPAGGMAGVEGGTEEGDHRLRVLVSVKVVGTL